MGAKGISRTHKRRGGDSIEITKQCSETGRQRRQRVLPREKDSVIDLEQETGMGAPWNQVGWEG